MMLSFWDLLEVECWCFHFSGYSSSGCFRSTRLMTSDARMKLLGPSIFMHALLGLSLLVLALLYLLLFWHFESNGQFNHLMFKVEDFDRFLKYLMSFKIRFCLFFSENGHYLNSFRYFFSYQKYVCYCQVFCQLLKLYEYIIQPQVQDLLYFYPRFSKD